MTDIELIKQVAELLSGNDFGKRYDLVSLAAEFSTALQAELDFTQEARYTEALRENLLVAVLVVKIIRSDNSIRSPHKFLGFESYSGT